MAPDRKLMAVDLQLRNGDAKASAPRVLFSDPYHCSSHRSFSNSRFPWMADF
jgi:hypothetical protein